MQERMHQENSRNVTILVTGGTGTLGRLVVARLRDAGRQVRLLGRTAPATCIDGVEFAAADLESGEGVEAAMAGIEVVVHCAGSGTGDEGKARRLVEAAKLAGVRHIVYISVVGADRMPVVSATDRRMFGYFAEKAGAERVIAESGIPWTSLRATQFHDLVFMVAEQMAKLPVVLLPRRMRVQPVDAGEVADRLVELALGAPAGLVPDLAGPRIYDAADVMRGYLRATGRRRPIVRIGLPGGAARAMLGGANLSPDRAVGERTWEDFLAERVGERVVA